MLYADQMVTHEGITAHVIIETRGDGQFQARLDKGDAVCGSSPEAALAALLGITPPAPTRPMGFHKKGN